MSEQLAMWWVALDILVSALAPNPSFFLFWGTFIRLGGLLGLGQGLEPELGLDNITTRNILNVKLMLNNRFLP